MRADEHGIGAGELGLERRGARVDGALGDDHAVARRVGDERELRSPVDGEGLEVAGVDPDRVGAERAGAGELVGIVRLDERVHPELARVGLQPPRLVVVEVAEQQEDGVGAGSPELRQLVLRREEALGEQRQRGRGTRGAKIGDRAAEALVDEHRDGRCAGRLEAAASTRGIGVRPQVAGRGRPALDLGDRGEPVLRRARHGAVPLARPPPREKAVSASSRSAAAPESTASVASAQAFGEVAGVPGRRDRAGGVEEDRVAARARSRRRTPRGSPPRSPPASLRAGRRARSARRRGRADRSRASRRRPSTTSPTSVRAGRRQLVDPARAVDDERTAGAEPAEHVCDHRHELLGVDADDLRSRSRRVRQRPEDVEDRSRRRAPAAPAPHGGSPDGAPARR